jgi:hypothetical protein
MKIANAAVACLIATSVLVSGCSKKEDGAGGAGSGGGSTPKTTGITGTFNGKPWTGKVAWLKLDAEAAKDSILYIFATDSKCKMPDLMGDDLGMVQVTSTPKKGVAQFDKDNIYGQVFWKKAPGSISSKDFNTGEIEWLAVPTATSKGAARIKIQKEGDKFEGSMEVSLCPPK